MGRKISGEAQNVCKFNKSEALRSWSLFIFFVKHHQGVEAKL